MEETCRRKQEFGEVVELYFCSLLELTSEGLCQKIYETILSTDWLNNWLDRTKWTDHIHGNNTQHRTIKVTTENRSFWCITTYSNVLFSVDFYQNQIMLNDMSSLPENLQIDMEKPNKDTLGSPALIPFF